MGGETVAGEARARARGATRRGAMDAARGGSGGEEESMETLEGVGGASRRTRRRRLARSGKWFERRASLDNAPTYFSGGPNAVSPSDAVT